MHIVFLTNEYPVQQAAHGGIGTFVQNLARNLVKNKIQVSIIGIVKKDENQFINDQGVLVYGISQSKWRIGKFIENSFRIREKINQINKDNPIDIVEGSELSFAFLPKKTTYKKVIRMHGGHHFFAVTLNKKPALWRSFQEKLSFKKADALIAVSNFVGVTTQKLVKFKQNFTTIYNYIDLEKFKSTANSKAIHNSIIFIGTVCEKKGIKQLIEAFPIVKEAFPEATLKVIGRDWKSKSIQSYTTHVKNLLPDNCKSAVTFFGAVPYTKIPELISQAEICVYPSHMESFGLTLIEAMAMNKMIVYSNIPPFNEIIVNEEEGLACDPFNPKDIASKIIRALEDKKESESRARNAFNSVYQKFNAEKLLEENSNFYKSIL